MVTASFSRRILLAPLFAIFLMEFPFSSLYPQKLLQPSRQTAYEALNKGDYEKAYTEFTILLASYPKDPIYKYYSGVCLVKGSREPEKASVYLREALESQLEIRPVPKDAWFYLGRSLQMAGRYAEAVKNYGLYERNAGKKAAREQNVVGFIQECNAGKGKLEDPVYGDLIEKTTGDSGIKSVINSQYGESSGSNEAADVKPESKSKNLPVSYDIKLTEAMDFQVKADSLNAVAAGYRKEYEKLPAGQKQSAKTRIDETETLAVNYQKLADERFGRSDTMGGRVKNAIPETTNVNNVERIIQDSARQAVDKSSSSGDLKQKQPELVSETTEIFSIFNIVSDLTLIRDQKIETDPVMPAGLFYRIQIGVYSKPLTLSYFKGIIPIFGFKITGSASLRYFAGMFRRKIDAGNALLGIRQNGFKDAFVVAVSDGKPVSLDRAASLEKIWGQKPFLTVTTAADNRQGISVAPTLIFRIELTKTLIPVNDEITDAFRNLAGNRGLEILMNGDRFFVYLIGKFITFESASEYAGLLKRNGYNDAKVVAYLGSREIEVEKARQLFEKAE